MIIGIALLLIFQNLIPVNNEIITVNVTYGPKGKFVREMVMVPKKEFEKLQNEYHDMETDNMNLVHQVSMLRAKPSSYYENLAKKIMENDTSDIENIDSSHIRELKRNSPGYVSNTTSNQVTEVMKNNSKSEFNTTISVQPMNMTKSTPKYEFKSTFSTRTKETTTNIPKQTFNKTNSNQGIETTSNIPKQELNTTTSVEKIELKTATIIPEVEFNTTNITQTIEKTLIIPKNEHQFSIQDIKLMTNMIRKHEFNMINASQITKTTIKNISNYEFNTTIIPVQYTKTLMTITKQNFNKTSKRNKKNKKNFNKTLAGLVETTTEDYGLISNTSEGQQLLQRLKEANTQNRALQNEMNDLKRLCNETNEFLFEFKWKMLIIQTIADYEDDFDKLELRQVRPPFQVNHTLVKKIADCWKYDHLAERRRQRWEFYLKTPPYCDNNFENLVKRIERSNYSIEEFCRALATLYKIISWDSHLETVKSTKTACGVLSLYREMHFVISILLEDYVKTELVENIFKELKL